MQIFRVCSIFVAVLYGIGGGQQNVSVYLALLHRLQQPDYIASIRPSANEGPVVVEVDVELKSIGPTWTTSFFLRQEWTDVRLKLDADRAGGGAGGGGGGAGSVVKLREDSVDSVWQPDLFFSNSKEGLRHQLTVPNRLLYVNVTTGRVLSTQRLTMVLQCEMDQGTFPHDNQTLTMMMESFSYNTEELVLKWSSRREIVNIQPAMQIPDFNIVGVLTTQCNQSYTSGIHPCLQAKVLLHRKVAYYIFHTYIPTILIVILSWASFWIDHDAAPARVSVGLLTVLTITTQLAGSRAQMPIVPYIKAIDVWMSVNLVFVFAAYMEYALVSMLARQYKKAVARKALLLLMQQQEPAEPQHSPNVEDSKDKTKTAMSRSTPITNTRAALSPPSPSSPPTPPPPLHPPPPPPPPHSRGTGETSDLATSDGVHQVYNRARLVDKRARVLFPLAFVIFNIGYWVYYLAYGG